MNMYLLGIDENGLGLTNQVMLGPLLVSAAGFELKKPISFKLPLNFKDKIFICDSKALFKRGQKKSYLFLEQTALSFLSLLKRKKPVNFDGDILRDFNIERLPCNLDGLCFFETPFELPLWLKEELPQGLEEFLQEQSLNFIYFKFAFLCPKLLYRKDKYKSEAVAFARLILDWKDKIRSQNYQVLCGMIKNYSPQTINDWWRKENFLIDTQRVNFIPQGDAKEFVIALASILGKYIREIFIERINRYFSYYDKDIPHCAGYRQNQSFDVFLERAKAVAKKNNVDLTCLVRV